MRRATQLECGVLSEFFDRSVPMLAHNLSPRGMWLESCYPLDIGTEVLLSFVPPRATYEFVTLAAVRHVELFRRRPDLRPSGMGLEFVDLPRAYSDALAVDLVGLPPPIPAARLRRCVVDPEVEVIDLDDPDLIVFEVLTGGRTCLPMPAAPIYASRPFVAA